MNYNLQIIKCKTLSLTAIKKIDCITVHAMIKSVMGQVLTSINELNK